MAFSNKGLALAYFCSWKSLLAFLVLFQLLFHGRIYQGGEGLGLLSLGA